MAKKKVTTKQYNGIAWDDLYFCTLASLVTLTDGETVQNKIIEISQAVQTLQSVDTATEERVTAVEQTVSNLKPGTAVTVGGVKQEEWDADTKLDKFKLTLDQVTTGMDLRGKTVVFNTNFRPDYFNYAFIDFVNGRALTENGRSDMGLGIVTSDSDTWGSGKMDILFYDMYARVWNQSSYTFPDEDGWIVTAQHMDSDQIPNCFTTSNLDIYGAPPYVPRSRKIGNAHLFDDVTVDEIGAAPKSHSHTSVSYGQGTSQLYGHLRLAGSSVASTLSTVTGAFAEHAYRYVTGYNQAIDVTTHFGAGRITVSSASPTLGLTNLINVPSDFPAAPATVYIDNFQGYDGNYRRQEVRANNSPDIWVRTLNSLSPSVNSNWSAWTKIGGDGGGAGSVTPLVGWKPIKNITLPTSKTGTWFFSLAELLGISQGSVYPLEQYKIHLNGFQNTSSFQPASLSPTANFIVKVYYINALTAVTTSQTPTYNDTTFFNFSTGNTVSSRVCNTALMLSTGSELELTICNQNGFSYALKCMSVYTDSGYCPSEMHLSSASVAFSEFINLGFVFAQPGHTTEYITVYKKTLL